LALVLAALGLGACGGDDDGGGSGGGGSDENQVTAVTERYISDPEPSVCTEIFTTEAVEEATGETGADAVKACEKGYEEQGAELAGEDIEVSGVEIAGASASAEVSYTNDGEKFSEHLTLVKEDGEWKIESAETQ
jgi:hypothetical protein